MSQLMHARALNLLADIGVDPDDARWFMKRLYDLGFAVVERDTQPGGTSPPGEVASDPVRPRHATRLSAIATMRAEVTAAQEEARAAEEAGRAAEREIREAEDAARARQLAVAKVLAEMPG